MKHKRWMVVRESRERRVETPMRLPDPPAAPTDMMHARVAWCMRMAWYMHRLM